MTWHSWSVSIPRGEIQDWLHGVAEIASAVNQPVSLPSLLNLIAETACRLMSVEFCGVLLPDPERRVLVIEGSYGLSPEYIAGVNALHPITLKEGITQAPSSRAFLAHSPVQVTDTGSDPDFGPWGRGARAQGFTSMVAVPLLVSGAALGTLNCYTTKQHEFTTDEIQLLTTLADQAAVAIATARLRAAEARTMEDLRNLNSSLEEQHGLLRQGEAIHQSLTDVALRQGGVGGVAEALCALLARPVVVDEPSGRPIASVPLDGVTLDLPDVQEDGLLEGTAQVAADGSLINVPSWEGQQTPGLRMIAPVKLDGETVARIWLPGQSSDLTQLDRRAVEHATTVLALEILRMRTALEVEWRMAGELLADVITANPTALATLLPRAERLGHDLTKPHSVLVARADETEDGPIPKILSGVRAAGAQVRPRPLIGAVGSYVVALWPSDGREYETSVSVSNRIRSAFRRADGRATLSIAVSQRCASLQEYPGAFRLGRGALELVRLRGRADETVTLGDLGPLGLLLQLEHIDELVAFTDRVLGPLRAYDNRRGTALRQTLAAYLQNNMNTAKTAADLHVHSNTVGLRVRKAEDLLQMSLADTESLIHIGMALMADEVVRVSTGSPRQS